MILSDIPCEVGQVFVRFAGDKEAAIGRNQRSKMLLFVTLSFVLPCRGGENLMLVAALILCVHLYSVKFSGILAQNLLHQPGGHILASIHSCHKLSLLRRIVVPIVGSG